MKSFEANYDIMEQVLFNNQDGYKICCPNVSQPVSEDQQQTLCKMPEYLANASFSMQVNFLNFS